MIRSSHTRWVMGMFAGAALLVASAAEAQLQIKANDDTFLKLGLLLQTQAEAAENPATGGYGQNLFVRRVRLLLGGQLAKNLTFFVETDSPNLGKSTAPGTKNSQPSLYLQDAYAEYRFSDALQIDAGLMLPSPSRNGLQSAATLMPVDYGSFTFANSGPTASNVGRDTGIQAKGYLANKHLEYRAGVFQGNRDQADRAFRFTGRLQYNFFDTESGFFYTGTYLGKKRILAVGGGIDKQDSYTGTAVDFFFDQPVGPGALTLQGDWIKFDGDSFLKTLPEQTEMLFEAGYLIGATKWQPVVQFTSRDYAGTGIDENRLSAGVNYFLNGHNANVKAQYTQIKPDGGQSSNQFSVQVQFFYF